jgi:ATP-dependent Lon protease
MRFLRLAKKNKKVDTKSWDDLYRNTVVLSIRKNVAPSMNEENAVLRKTLAQVIDMIIAKTDLTEEQASLIFSEFFDYNRAIEQCKAEVKQELDIE